MVDWVKPYFGEMVIWEEDAAKKFLTPAIAPALRKLLTGLSPVPDFQN
jgi:glutamyl-tRNA synthetase